MDLIFLHEIVLFLKSISEKPIFSKIIKLFKLSINLFVFEYIIYKGWNQNSQVEEMHRTKYGEVDVSIELLYPL